MKFDFIKAIETLHLHQIKYYFEKVDKGGSNMTKKELAKKHFSINIQYLFDLNEKVEEAMNDKNKLFSLDPDNISDDIEWICQDTKKYLDILNDGKQFPVMCGYNYTLQNVSDMAKQSNYQLKHKQKLVQNKR